MNCDVTEAVRPSKSHMADLNKKSISFADRIYSFFIDLFDCYIVQSCFIFLLWMCSWYSIASQNRLFSLNLIKLQTSSFMKIVRQWHLSLSCDNRCQRFCISDRCFNSEHDFNPWESRDWFRFRKMMSSKRMICVLHFISDKATRHINSCK